MIAQIKQDAITGHESAILAYTTVIANLMPLQRNKLVDTLINQYLQEIKILKVELLEMING